MIIGSEKHDDWNVPGAASLTCCARSRYRHKIGHDIALEGLKEGLRQRRATPDQLWRFAQQGRIWSVMRPYVEAMIVDGA